MKRPSEEELGAPQAPCLPDDVLRLLFQYTLLREQEEEEEEEEEREWKTPFLPLLCFLSCCRAYRAFFTGGTGRCMALLLLDTDAGMMMRRYMEARRPGAERPYWLRPLLADALAELVAHGHFYLAMLCFPPLRIAHFLRTGRLPYNLGADALCRALLRWPQALEPRGTADWSQLVRDSSQAEWEDETAWCGGGGADDPALTAFHKLCGRIELAVERFLAVSGTGRINGHGQGGIAYVPPGLATGEWSGFLLTNPWGIRLKFDEVEGLARYVCVMYFYCRRRGFPFPYGDGYDDGGRDPAQLTVDRLFLRLDALAEECPAQFALLAPLLVQ